MAFAADSKASNLPGVGSDFSIVKPSSGEPEAVVADEDGFVVIPGTDTRMKISGMIRYDVDVSTENKKAPRIHIPRN